MIAERANTGYIMERLDEYNLADMVQLHNMLYGRNIAVGYFHKKYDTCFTGVKYLGYLAYNNQKAPVAYYGVIPVLIKSGGQLMLSAQSADTMTHPDHRFKGLFTELALLTYQLCKENNIRFIFGFPNQNSLPGFINKLGWEVADQMDCFIINTGTCKLAKVLRKMVRVTSLFTGYQQRCLSKYSCPQKGLYNQFPKEDHSGIFRDQDYLIYKVYGDAIVIKTGNALVWLKVSKHLLIGDMQLSPTDFEAVMFLLKKLARKLLISEIHFHSSRGTTLHVLFSTCFNAIPSFPVIVKNLSAEQMPKELKFTSADIDTF